MNIANKIIIYFQYNVCKNSEPKRANNKGKIKNNKVYN